MVAVAGRIQDPSQQHRHQDEGDKSTDQRPEHAANISDGPGLAQAGTGPLRLSGMQRDLLVGRRERPGHLLAAFLTEYESQLAGRPQAVRVGRPEGSARPLVGDRAQKILTEEAVLTACLSGFARTIPHN
jgi:hypothetical protein